MSMLKVLIHQLIPVERMEYMSAEELIEHVCLHMYNPEAAPLRERESFDKLPATLRDIILIIDLDTELNMNGIVGFLENSSGLYLNDTIETLERIPCLAGL